MITFEKGDKGEGDLRVILNGHWIHMTELAEMVVQLCKNEEIDDMYPKYRCLVPIEGVWDMDKNRPMRCRKTKAEHNGHTGHNFFPFKGGQKLIDFFQECYNAGEVTDDILRKFKLGQYRPDR